MLETDTKRRSFSFIGYGDMQETALNFRGVVLTANTSDSKPEALGSNPSISASFVVKW